MKRALMVECGYSDRRSRSHLDSLKSLLQQKGFDIASVQEEADARAFLCQHSVALVVILNEVDPDLNGDRFVLFCHTELQPVPVVLAVRAFSKPYIKRIYSTDRYYEVGAMGYFAAMDLQIPLSSSSKRALDLLLDDL